jgi:uncharacterized membrane protein YeaQ/YmgE (transglycosylase-associated protein family)
MMLSILGGTLCGLMTGILATYVLPCRDRRDWFATLLFGVARALLGDRLGRWLGVPEVGDMVDALMPLLGALVLVVPYRLLASRQL